MLSLSRSVKLPPDVGQLGCTSHTDAKMVVFSVCCGIFNDPLKCKCNFSLVSFVVNFSFDFCTFRKLSLSMVPLLFKIGLCQEAQFTGNFGFSMF